MNMRRVVADHINGRMFRMMDHGMASLIDRPELRRTAGHRVSSAQVGPPNLLEPTFPERRVERADHKATNAIIVLHDKGEIRLERGVWGRVDVADELAVRVEMGRITARMTGGQRYRIESREVAGLEKAKLQHLHTLAE